MKGGYQLEDLDDVEEKKKLRDVKDAEKQVLEPLCFVIAINHIIVVLF